MKEKVVSQCKSSRSILIGEECDPGQPHFASVRNCYLSYGIDALESRRTVKRQRRLLNQATDTSGVMYQVCIPFLYPIICNYLTSFCDNISSLWYLTNPLSCMAVDWVGGSCPLTVVTVKARTNVMSALSPTTKFLISFTHPRCHYPVVIEVSTERRHRQLFNGGYSL